MMSGAETPIFQQHKHKRVNELQIGKLHWRKLCLTVCALQCQSMGERVSGRRANCPQ